MKLTQITNPVALRLDTTVGTRIFAGNTLIYGDTGWRDISSAFPDYFVPSTANGSGLFMKREGTTVSMQFQAVEMVQSEGNKPVLPYGFRALGYLYFWIQGGSMRAYSNNFYSILTTESAIKATLSFETADPWPLTLPGIPGNPR